MTVSISGTGGVTFNDNSVQNTAATGFGFKNRIINGAMMVNQRGAVNTPVTPTNGDYTLDRWLAGVDQTGKFSVQQSSTATTGYVNSLLCTSLSAYTVLSTDSFQMRQNIEGLNVSDLAWGTASASTVTLSFWVRSSLTGTFGGSIVNNAYDRSYPFSYTVSAANTWEQKSVTIAGDTSGTWLTTNGVGIRVGFGLGAGAGKSTTAGAWASGFYAQPTGATSVVGTNGATFYITGVQLEKGSTATSFDYRPYGTELGLCQRYFYKNAPSAIADSGLGSGQQASLTNSPIILTIPVPMRSAPTLTQSNLIVSDMRTFDSNVSAVDAGYFGTGTTGYANFTNASAGAIDRPVMLRTKSTGSIGFLAFSAEL